MTALPVAAVLYFTVCGGPIGSEGIFSAGGPLVGLISLVLIPFIWCIPIGLLTAELSTAYPENSTYT